MNYLSRIVTLQRQVYTFQLGLAFRVENDGVHLSEERQNQVAFEILKETLLAEAKALAEKYFLFPNILDFI